MRRAVSEDAAAIAAVHVRTWQVAYRGLMPDELLDGLSVARRETFWRDALVGKHAPGVVVAVSDGALVGFCAVVAPSRDADVDELVAEIGAIYVDPDVWRSGVGRRLMEVALADLRAAGWYSVTLWVLAEIHQAREFYSRFGFESDGSETVDESSGQTEVRLRASLNR